MTILKFSQNWNGKLLNNIFTTIRLHKRGRYNRGDLCQVECENFDKFEAIIKGIDTIFLHLICNSITQKDIGKNAEEFRKIFKQIYPESTNNTLVDVMFLQKTKEQSN